METVQIQRQKVSRIDAKLDKITELLESVMKELKENGPYVKLSKKAQKAVEKGLKELKTGRYTEYKDFESFRKALS